MGYRWPQGKKALPLPEPKTLPSRAKGLFLRTILFCPGVGEEEVGWSKKGNGKFFSDEGEEKQVY